MNIISAFSRSKNIILLPHNLVIVKEVQWLPCRSIDSAGAVLYVLKAVLPFQEIVFLDYFKAQYGVFVKIISTSQGLLVK